MLLVLASVNCCMKTNKIITNKNFHEESNKISMYFKNLSTNDRIYKLNLDANTKIEIPFSLKFKNKRIQIKCDSFCDLYVADNNPSGNFGHEVEIGIVDRMTGKGKRFKSKWYPLIDDTPYFVYQKKGNQSNIIRILKNIPENILPKINIFTCISNIQNDSCSNYKFSDSPFPNTEIPDALVGKNHVTLGSNSVVDKIWAIVICGSFANGDILAFAKDTDSMYSVLSGYGVPTDHIYYFMPEDVKNFIKKWENNSYPDYKSNFKFKNIQNVRNNTETIDNAFKEIAKEFQKEENKKGKFLFFISTHGDVDRLSIWDGNDSISAKKLKNWLKTIKCEQMTILLESCYSGSFIGYNYFLCKEYWPFSDDLINICPDNKNRVVIASACGNEISYSDMDPGDNSNRDEIENDSGTEFMGAFIEAFTKQAGADSEHDEKISIDEAFQYALKRSINANKNCIGHLKDKEKCNHPVCLSTGIDLKTEFFFWDE